MRLHEEEANQGLKRLGGFNKRKMSLCIDPSPTRFEI